MKSNGIISLEMQTAPCDASSFSCAASKSNSCDEIIPQISFALSVPASASLEVYNIKGQRVSTLVDDFMTAGNYTVNWNGTNMSGDRVASGIYLYRLVVDGVASHMDRLEAHGNGQVPTVVSTAWRLLTN